MDALKKLLLVISATLVALALVVGPAVAVDDPAEGGEEMPAEGEAEGGTDDIVGEHGEAEGGKIQIAQTPRDQVGLIFLSALIVAGGLAFANGRRQLKGERPTATGEFRWR
jgi:hypothetical protein